MHVFQEVRASSYNRSEISFVLCKLLEMYAVFLLLFFVFLLLLVIFLLLLLLVFRLPIPPCPLFSTFSSGVSFFYVVTIITA